MNRSRPLRLSGSCTLVTLLLALLTGASRAHADSSFALKLETPTAKKGGRSVARVRIVPGAGYHLNKEYPTSVSVVAPAGVSVEKPKLSARDAVKLEEAGAEFELAFTAAEAGRKSFTGELKFAVCTASTCDPKKAKLAFTVEVH